MPVQSFCFATAFCVLLGIPTSAQSTKPTAASAKRSAAPSLVPLISKIRQSTVTLVTKDSELDPLAQGTAFFIGREGHLITSRHVLEGACFAELPFAGGYNFAYDLVAEDADADLVELDVRFKYPGAYPTGLPLATRLPPAGTRVVVLGSPLGLELSASEGIVSGLPVVPPYGRVIQITAPISPGSSGSPVVSVSTGEVLGVAAFTHSEGQALNFAIPASRILQLHPDRRSIKAWSAGISDEQLAMSDGFVERGLEIRAYDLPKSASVPAQRLPYRLPYFEEALRLNPANTRAAVALSGEYMDLGRAAEGLQVLERSARLRFPSRQILLLLAFEYESRGRLREADARFREAFQRSPESADALVQLTEFLRRQGRDNEADRTMDQFIRSRDNAAKAWLEMAREYTRLVGSNPVGQGRALKAFEKVLTINPYHFGAYEELSEFQLVQLGNKPLAIQTLKTALRRWEELGRNAKPPTTFDPDPLLLTRLANTYCGFTPETGPIPNAEDMRRAIETYQAVIAAHPRLAEAHGSLGWCYSHTFHNTEAAEAYERALALEENEKWRCDLGDIYVRLGNRIAAQRQYEAIKNSKDWFVRDRAERLHKAIEEASPGP